MDVSAPIAQMNGAELHRAFLTSIQEYHKLNKMVRQAHIADLDEEDLARTAREVIVMNYNIGEMADRISVELGIPIR